MNARLVLAAMLLGTALALLAPSPIAAVLLVSGFVAMREGRRGLVALLGVSLVINVSLVGLSVSGAALPYIPWLSVEGVKLGALATLRLGAALALNLATLQRAPPARLLDGLGLPRRATALLAAVLLAAHDVKRDFDRLILARRLEGDWPAGRLGRARTAASLLPAVLLSSHERSRTRHDALRLAGLDMGALFVPIVAVAALAAAGRLAFLALPNVALTYTVVFLGGLLFGPLAAALGGGLGMLLTDFFLTGLYPTAFVNVPAMMGLGLLGGLCRRIDFTGTTRADRIAGALFAASLGVASTFVFSVLADTLTWALVLRAAPSAWAGLVLAGLAFNVLPAFVNGALFAASVGPTRAAFEALDRARARQPQKRPRAQEPDAPPAERLPG